MVQILQLAGHHDKKAFDCGNPTLNAWLVSMANQHKEKGLSTTYVATSSDTSTEIFGFYSISLAELRTTEVPLKLRRKLPNKVSVVRLGRLAVGRQHQGTGLGKQLLANAFSRLSRIASEISGVGIVVDAKPESVEFYLNYGFEQMDDHPLTLFLKF